MATNNTLIFKKAPSGPLPTPGEHITVESRPFDPSSPPPKGGLTLSILLVSLDPFLTDRIRDPAVESWIPAYDLNGPITNDGIARVLKSDTPAYKAGDLVLADLPMAEFATFTAEEVSSRVKNVLNNPHNFEDLSLFLGPLGMTGLTAYSSLFEIGKPKAGETIFISSASGAVGQIVGQIAKREGLKVIGSVGSDDKLAYIVDELGFDGGFNYKKEKTKDALARLAPEGLDIYYDNVGGEQLDGAIWHIKVGARIVVCGMITQYGKPPEEWTGIKNLLLFLERRATMRSFLVWDEEFGPRYKEEHVEKMGKWLAEGSIKVKFAMTEGVENSAEGLVDLFRGKNFGKAVLRVKRE
jgi:NADPH-dependent curcumin reductase CurA